MKFLDLKKQHKLIKKKIYSNISRVFQETDFILGKEVFELEKKLSAYVKTKFCISVGNGVRNIVWNGHF